MHRLVRVTMRRPPSIFIDGMYFLTDKEYQNACKLLSEHDDFVGTFFLDNVEVSYNADDVANELNDSVEINDNEYKMLQAILPDNKTPSFLAEFKNIFEVIDDERR